MKIPIKNNSLLNKIFDKLWNEFCIHGHIFYEHDFNKWLFSFDHIIITDNDNLDSWQNECFVFESEEDYFLFLMKWS